QSERLLHGPAGDPEPAEPPELGPPRDPDLREVECSIRVPAVPLLEPSPAAGALVPLGHGHLRSRSWGLGTIRVPMMTKEEFLDSCAHETRVIRHLAGKILPGGLDWKPTPVQRTTLELLRYLTSCAIVP